MQGLPSCQSRNLCNMRDHPSSSEASSMAPGLLHEVTHPLWSAWASLSLVVKTAGAQLLRVITW